MLKTKRCRKLDRVGENYKNTEHEKFDFDDCNFNHDCKLQQRP